MHPVCAALSDTRGAFILAFYLHALDAGRKFDAIIATS
jgi:hypothetical protein